MYRIASAVTPDNADIRFKLLQIVQDFLDQSKTNRAFDAGAPIAPGREKFLDIVGTDSTEFEFANHKILGGIWEGDGFLFMAVEIVRDAVKRLACRSQSDSPALAVEQLDAKSRLQVAEMRRNGRLADNPFLRCARETTLCRHMTERFKPLLIH